MRVFYTAPTLIRALMQHGDEPVKRHDRSSLRVLGTVGEPIGAHPHYARLPAPRSLCSIGNPRRQIVGAVAYVTCHVYHERGVWAFDDGPLSDPLPMFCRRRSLEVV